MTTKLFFPKKKEEENNLTFPKCIDVTDNRPKVAGGPFQVSHLVDLNKESPATEVQEQEFSGTLFHEL